MGAMKKLRSSKHSNKHTSLRELFIQRRQNLGLSQRALAERLGVIYSLLNLLLKERS